MCRRRRGNSISRVLLLLLPATATPAHQALHRRATSTLQALAAHFKGRVGGPPSTRPSRGPPDGVGASAARRATEHGDSAAQAGLHFHQFRQLFHALCVYRGVFVFGRDRGGGYVSGWIGVWGGNLAKGGHSV